MFLGPREAEKWPWPPYLHIPERPGFREAGSRNSVEKALGLEDADLE
jgi:hypothetical protein